MICEETTINLTVFGNMKLDVVQLDLAFDGSIVAALVDAIYPHTFFIAHFDKKGTLLKIYQQKPKTLIATSQDRRCSNFVVLGYEKVFVIRDKLIMIDLRTGIQIQVAYQFHQTDFFHILFAFNKSGLIGVVEDWCTSRNILDQKIKVTYFGFARLKRKEITSNVFNHRDQTGEETMSRSVFQSNQNSLIAFQQNDGNLLLHYLDPIDTKVYIPKFKLVTLSSGLYNLDFFWQIQPNRKYIFNIFDEDYEQGQLNVIDVQSNLITPYRIKYFEHQCEQIKEFHFFDNRFCLKTRSSIAPYHYSVFLIDTRMKDIVLWEMIDSCNQFRFVGPNSSILIAASKNRHQNLIKIRKMAPICRKSLQMELLLSQNSSELFSDLLQDAIDLLN